MASDQLKSRKTIEELRLRRADNISLLITPTVPVSTVLWSTFILVNGCKTHPSCTAELHVSVPNDFVHDVDVNRTRMKLAHSRSVNYRGEDTYPRHSPEIYNLGRLPQFTSDESPWRLGSNYPRFDLKSMTEYYLHNV